MKRQTVMVSLDTSTTKTGYAVFVNGEYKKSGVIDHSKEKDTYTRIENMVNAIYDILKTEKARIVVVELTAVPRGVSAQRYLTQVLGAVWGYSILKHIEYVEYRPTTWRKLVSDKNEKVPRKREELKAWSIKKAKKMGYRVKDDNEADAILLGLARIKEFIHL